MTRKQFALYVVIAAMFVLGKAEAHEFQVGQIQIDHPFVRAMLPGATVGGGYMKITNNGGEDRLIGARSERAGSVQLHEMRMDGNVMVMRERKAGMVLPAGAMVEMAPGGDHLMFLNVDRPFREGEMIKATLVFEKTGPVEVEFSVGPVAGGKPKTGDHAGHGR